MSDANIKESKDRTEISVPLESKNMRVITQGEGVKRKSEALKDVATFFPLFYSPLEKRDDVGLIQGSPQVGVIENGIGITFQTLFGYYIRDPEDRTIPSPQQLEGRYEKNANAYGYYAYKTALGRIRDYFKTNVIKIEKAIDSTESTIQILLNELQAKQDSITITLEEMYTRLDRLRDERGTHRCLGLSSLRDKKERQPCTTMIIPKLIQQGGTTASDVLFRGRPSPLQPGTKIPIMPEDEHIAHSIFEGIVQAFEDQSVYQMRTAIRAAEFYYIFKGDFGLERMMTAASRAGTFPRLGSLDMQGVFMWQRLAALSMTMNFFKNHYGITTPQNIGQMSYIFGGTGPSKTLENLINMYISSTMTPIQYETGTNTMSGLFFMPADNIEGSEYRMAFFGHTDNPAGYTRMDIVDLRDQLKYNMDPTPIEIDEDGDRIMTEEQQTSVKEFPVIIRPTHAVKQRKHLLPMGFQQQTMEITDIVDPQMWQPSELMRVMMVAWPFAYTPKSVIMRKTFSPCRLAEFKDFELIVADRATYAPGKVLG